MSSNEFSFLKKRSISDQADYISDFLPDDETFEGKIIANTNIRKILEVFGVQLKKLEEFINLFTIETDPSCAENLLEEWERMLGIPDDCYLVENETLEDRQRNALIKLSKMSVQTNQDFENLANSFGITATVQSGIDFVNAGGTPFGGGDTEARFTVVITFEEAPDQVFPLTFPILFGSSILGILECVFRKVLPANCNAKFIVNIPEALGDFYFSMSLPENIRYKFAANQYGTLASPITLQSGDTVSFSYDDVDSVSTSDYFIDASIAQINQSSALGAISGAVELNGYTLTIDGVAFVNGDFWPGTSSGGVTQQKSRRVVLTATGDTDFQFLSADNAGLNGTTLMIYDLDVSTVAQDYNWPIRTRLSSTQSETIVGGNDLTISSYTESKWNNWPFQINEVDNLPAMAMNNSNTGGSFSYQQPSMRSNGLKSCTHFSGVEDYYRIDYHVGEFEVSKIPYSSGFTIECIARYLGNTTAGSSSNGRMCGVVQAFNNSAPETLWAMTFNNYHDITGAESVKPSFSLLKRDDIYFNNTDFVNNVADIRSTTDAVINDVYHLMATIRPSDRSVEFWVNGVSQGSVIIGVSEWDAWTKVGHPSDDILNGSQETRFQVGPCFAGGAFRAGQETHIQDVKIHLLEADDAFAVNQASFANFT